MKLFKYLLVVIIILIPFENISAQVYRAMTYNIRMDTKSDGINQWEHRKESMINLIIKNKVDILGIQEGMYHQVLFLNEKLENYRYVGVGRDDGVNKGEFSSIFYDSTKFCAMENTTFWLSENPESVSVGWDAALERICTYGLFQDRTSKNKFWVFNTHFDHVGKTAREKSAELIMKKIIDLNNQNLPIILMGDLNSKPESNPIKILNQYLNDAYLKSDSNHEGPQGTYTGFKDPVTEEKRIDYIFLKGFSVITLKHLSDMREDGYFISDHLPVIGELKLMDFK